MMQTFEIIATISGIAAVFLQTKENIWAWPLAILSVGISVIIFYSSQLYSDLGLHIVYVFLNIYGWYVWSNHSEVFESVRMTKVMNRRAIFSAIAISILGGLTLGAGMNHYTNADMAYIDACTTSTSLVAQYLLAKKYLQNWLFWIAVDLVAIPLYIYKGLYYFAFLFGVYLVLCIWGYVSWWKNLKMEQMVPDAPV